MGWTIREAAEKCGLTLHTLGWYERIGLLDRIDRTADGRRCFTEADLEWLLLLSRLRVTGMPVRDMLRYAELVRSQAGKPERLELLHATAGASVRGCSNSRSAGNCSIPKSGSTAAAYPRPNRDRAELTCATFHWANSPSRRRALAAWA
jgi:DNA-binding transcriptional MerR regulator